MSTIHINASKESVADVVLMPGDPLRAKYIAEKFLDNPVCFNETRGMYGFTGMYKNKKVSVMGSGMGTASMGIYSYELYKFFDVKKIIRIGTCGAYDETLNLLDVLAVDKAYSESNFALTFRSSNSHIACSSKKLTNTICEVAKSNNINVTNATVLTSEFFESYIPNFEEFKNRWPKDFNMMASEMEAYALFNVADELEKEAACILTVADKIGKDESVSPTDRERALDDMIKIALEAAIK